VYKSADFHGRGWRIVNMGEMFGYDFISDQEMNSVALTSSEMAVAALQDGDLLFGRRSVVESGAGKCSLVVSPKTPLAFESSIIRARLKTDVALPLYFFYFFQSPPGRRRIRGIVSGTNVKGIRGSELRDLSVPLPCPAEQQAIAAALSDVDALLGGLDRLIAKKRDLKQAAMQQLLTGKTRLPGFKGQWEVASLSTLCGMKSGEGITSADIDYFSTYPCYGGNGLRGYTSRFTHDGGFALIGRQGALCGNVVGVEGKFFASEHAVVVTPNSKTDIRWLTYVLATMNLNQYSESSAQPGLSVSKILILDVNFPPGRLQVGRAEQLK